ncbi:MAG: c-type cytochrome [Nitrosomonadales bacterium]|nr:c-type cytochrome [Nitrosomonadales bacterium]
MKILNFVAITLFANILASTASAQVPEGKPPYDKGCSFCHNAGIAGAPRLGDPDAWRDRVAGGMARLYKSALEGTPKGMPSRGGVDGRSLTDNEIKYAVDYMVDKVKDALAAAPASADPAANAAAAAVQPTAPVLFSFNRLLRPLDKRNLAPPDDGIHDPENEGTHMLQSPAVGLADFVKSNFGNRVDWVATLESGKISPRWERTNPDAEGIVMDMNILRVPRGFMPNVVFPHKQHTEWLECSNCHPAIFIPQKGANQISMPLILLGQKCGVCHGKVSFPISECRKCHSQKKDAPQKAVGTP